MCSGTVLGASNLVINNKETVPAPGSKILLFLMHMEGWGREREGSYISKGY